MRETSVETESVWEGYRRWGYLAAKLDPLGFLTPMVHPELVVEGETAAAARKFYCGTIGAEFVHIDDTERRRWIAERLESEPPQPDRAFILERLIRAELFEQVLQARYLGSKRFSLEGVTAVIPLLDRVLSVAAAAECHSSHPLADAIVEEARLREIQYSTSQDSKIIHGKGLHCMVETEKILIGSMFNYFSAGNLENAAA